VAIVKRAVPFGVNRRFAMAGVKIVALGVLLSILLAQKTTADPIDQPAADAFVNLGAGPYPEASALTTGNPQPWYDSPAVVNLFGGTPNAQQQASFDTVVLQRVERTFQLSGVPVNLTDDPSVSAAHTLSLVSDASSKTIGNAIGMTDLGANGFSFIDRIAPMASSVDQLEWIVAHNIAHELMLAFGVGENYDQSGNYIDARNASFAMMTSSNAGFSTAAAEALRSSLATAGLPSIAAESLLSTTSTNPEPILPFAIGEPQTVAEPSTVAFWVLASASLIASGRFPLRRHGARVDQRQAVRTASSSVG
jgi:hypothetical protein